MSVATILVVEDDPANRELMIGLLESHGYQVCRAADGYTAIAMARIERPSLILMDLGLPGLDGAQTTQRLKADPVGGVNSDRGRNGSRRRRGAPGESCRV